MARQDESPWELYFRPNLKALKKVMNAKDLIGDLFSKKLIDSNEYETLRAKKATRSNAEIVEELMTILPLKIPHEENYEEFRQILLDKERQGHLVDMFFPKWSQAGCSAPAKEGKFWVYLFAEIWKSLSVFFWLYNGKDSCLCSSCSNSFT